MAVLFRESAVVKLHQTRGRLFVNILSHTVGCGAANGCFVEIWGRITARPVRRATAMAIRDAMHRYDLSVPWLITRREPLTVDIITTATLRRQVPTVLGSSAK